MSVLEISKPDKHIAGEIQLVGSKSIANRVLIIRALATEKFDILGLPTAKDTVTLNALLKQTDNLVYDAGHAGTTFRFLTAYLALQPQIHILTGSERMKQRPIGKLVSALNDLGFDIEYIENEGFPPLKINPPTHILKNEITIAADTSSQYITALLLIAPLLPEGLKLHLTGDIVSRPYIEMTLSLMKNFGISSAWIENTISIEKQNYLAKIFTVEADWSAASYYYALACISDSCNLKLKGVFENSLQGDSVITKIATQFGVHSQFDAEGVTLTKTEKKQPDIFEYDFKECPDIAQTLAVICAATGTQGLFSGLETLFIKETDRVAALKTELAKIGVSFSKLPKKFSTKSDKQFFMIEGSAAFTATPQFATYDDHRMAMAFAPLALLHSVKIEEPKVVEKSYPEFWEDFSKIGFVVRH